MVNRKPKTMSLRERVRAKLRPATKRATTKRRVTETTEQKIKRLETSIGSYLHDNMQAALDAAAAEIKRQDAGRPAPVKTGGKIDSTTFLSELYRAE